MNVELILVAVDDDLDAAWRAWCADLPGVAVHRGSILEVDTDAVVSPANSFGFMDGGIDALYTDHFGTQVQRSLQAQIAEDFSGELLVGQTAVVDTGDTAIPFLVAAPTMRVPMVLGAETVNPYLAARAALRLVSRGVFTRGRLAGQPVDEYLHRLAMPGLGTGVGQVPAEVCARQVRQAWLDVRDGLPFPTDWWESSERHQRLYGDTPRDLQWG